MRGLSLLRQIAACVLLSGAQEKYLADVYSGTVSGATFYEFYRSGVFNSIKPTFILPEVTITSTAAKIFSRLRQNRLSKY